MSRFVSVGLLCLVVGACGDQTVDTPAAPPEMPKFTDAGLMKGRSVWMESCRACHLLGVGGAPGVADYPAWAPRLAKDRASLYRSVFEGVTDAAGNPVKPPRGGNPRLTDDQVRRAVDYMVEAVERLRNSG